AVTLTDSRPVTASASLDVQYNTSLRILTGPSPNASGYGISTVTDDLSDYSFQMQAAGGSGTDTWEINPAATLPTGVVATGWNGTPLLQSSGGGLFSGTNSSVAGNYPISVTLTDGVSSPVTESFTIRTVAA